MGFVLGEQRGAVGVGEQAVPAGGVLQIDLARLGPGLATQTRLGDLAGGGDGHRAEDPHEPRSPLGAHVGLGAAELAEGGRVEAGAGLELDRGHHLVARTGVGDGVDGHHQHTGEAVEDPLDRAGGEVLAVHADLVAGAAREVEEPVRVPVAQVAGVEALADVALGGGLRVAVVALEQGGTAEVADLADRLGGVGEPTVGVEPRGRALAPLLVEDRHVHMRARHPERTGRGVGGAGDHHAALAAAVRLAGRHAEPARELGPVVRRRLGAEHDPQRRVRLLRPFGPGQHVRERPPDVVDVGGTEPQHIRQETRGGEPATHGERAADVGRGRERGHEGVAVEQGHRTVGDVAADQPPVVDRAEHGQPPGRAHHGLGRAGRAGGEQ